MYQLHRTRAFCGELVFICPVECCLFCFPLLPFGLTRTPSCEHLTSVPQTNNSIFDTFEVGRFVSRGGAQTKACLRVCHHVMARYASVMQQRCVSLAICVLHFYSPFLTIIDSIRSYAV